MEKAKIALIAIFVLIGSALVFVFRYNSKKDEANKKMMAEVRASRGLKKYVTNENLNEYEEIENNKLQKSE